MQLLRHPAEARANPKGSVVALGNFDGFHKGHQVVVGEAGRLARALGLDLTVVVTEPHPVNFFRPDVAPFRLTPFRERVTMMETFGVDRLLVLTFDKSLASMAAQDFVLDILVGDLGAQHIVVGYDYRFGQGRGGGTDVLAHMGGEEGFGLSVISPVLPEGAPQAVEPGRAYSSTLVRETLKAGKPRQAADLLGHWWAISGKVQAGDQRGRTIGFPTANIALGDVIEPRLGVYAVRIVNEDAPDAPPLKGVANLGRRPTFDKRDILLEVHVFDFDGDLYDQHLRIEFVDFIRPERKFSGDDVLAQLTEQIARDSAEARTILADPAHRRDRLRRPTLAAYLAQNPNWPGPDS